MEDGVKLRSSLDDLLKRIVTPLPKIKLQAGCPRGHLTTKLVAVTNNTFVKILSPFDGDIYPESQGFWTCNLFLKIFT
jgi:hypothetical protein